MAMVLGLVVKVKPDASLPSATQSASIARRTATEMEPMRLMPLLASLTALTAYVPLAWAQQGEVLRVGMRDDPDILDPTFSRTMSAPW
jgi:hypothetical protein